MIFCTYSTQCLVAIHGLTEEGIHVFLWSFPFWDGDISHQKIRAHSSNHLICVLPISGDAEATHSVWEKCTRILFVQIESMRTCTKQLRLLEEERSHSKKWWVDQVLTGEIVPCLGLHRCRLWMADIGRCNCWWLGYDFLHIFHTMFGCDSWADRRGNSCLPVEFSFLGWWHFSSKDKGTLLQPLNLCSSNQWWCRMASAVRLAGLPGIESLHQIELRSYKDRNCSACHRPAQENNHSDHW